MSDKNPTLLVSKISLVMQKTVRRFLNATIVLALLGVSGVTVFGAPAGRITLHGHVPAILSKLAPNGRLAATNVLNLAIGLPLRNEGQLDELLRQIYDPASTNFHHYLTPAEFTARFGPTEADYLAVQEFARANGLTITGIHPNRVVLDVQASVGNIERVFQVKLQTYRHPHETRDFYAPDAEPSANFPAAVLQVSGLDNYSLPRPKSISKPQAGAVPRGGSGPSGAYRGVDFRNAYVPGTTLTGAGQSVALLQFDGYYSNDIVSYATGAGIAMVSLTNVLINGGVAVPGAGNGEVCLDIEMVMSMAPGVSRIIVYEGPNGSTAWSTILSRIANDNLAQQVSCSWGATAPGSPDLTSEGIFKQMSAQGQSFFNASGDSCAFVGGIPFPSESTNITQVGGTTLTTGTSAAYASETVWNWGGGTGSSGGVSANFGIPPWQQGISMVANHGSTAMRNVPDVALTGDNVFVTYSNGLTGNFGGTSCAAPLWAGFMALVNQQAASLGNPSAGFINPAIYAIGKGSNANYSYSACFHDITTGNNYWSSSLANFPAVTGFDLCTGWGTPNGVNLIYALAGSPDGLVVTPNTGFNVSGAVGGPFTGSTQIFAVTNTSAATLNWSLVNTSAWLTASTTGGSLASVVGTNITVSLTSAANSLAVGTYTAVVQFSNQTTLVAQPRNFTLQVLPVLLVQPQTGFAASGIVGGPFNVTSQSYALTNIGATPLNWGIVNTSAWLTVSSSGGTLASGANTSLMVSLTATATNLAAGNYTSTVMVTNSAGSSQNLNFTLQVRSSLVQNGDFETGDFTGWTQSGDTSGTAVITGNAAYVHAGSYGAQFGPSTGRGYITQTLTTQAGQSYLLSFWLANPVGGSGTMRFQASWNGSTITNINPAPVFTWQQFTFLVTATGTSTTLQFGFQNNPDYFGFDDVTVIPVTLPAITVQPTNVTVFAGSNATFSATVSGTAPLTYRWRKNGTNISNGSGISGATTNLLALTGVTTNNAGNYSLYVTNFYGSVTSSVASLAVVLPPAITSSSLTNRTVECAINTNTFIFTAAGTAPLKIQWRTNGVIVLGATNTTFSLTNMHLPSCTVSVAVTNLYGTVTSNALLNIQDTLAPVITLSGSSQMTNELGSAFTDPGATATDACAGPVAVIVSGVVITNVVGTNTLTYTATDGNGKTNTATRTVIVRDTKPPVISWSFTNLVLVANTNCNAVMPDVTGTNYLLATDLSGSLTITQSPTNNALLFLGTNAVVITVKDPSGNAAYSTNKIIVRDQTPPVITLNGASLIFCEFGQVFLDPGATANDSCAGVVPVTTSGLVNTNALGTNTLTYLATDGNGNTNTATRTVVVRDTTPPTILWSFTNLVLAADTNCSATMPDVTGTNFIRATDLSGPLTISQSPTNTAVLLPGTNLVVITVKDTSANATYSTNAIVVQDQTPPIITLNGGNPFYLALGSAFTDPGATAFDACAGAVPVTVSGGVNPNIAGTNTLIYTAADSSHNTNTITRTVIVQDTAPVIAGVSVASGGDVTLNLAGAPNRQYVLESTENIFPAIWLPVATNILGATGVWQFTDAQATNFTHRFYRLKLLP